MNGDVTGNGLLSLSSDNFIDRKLLGLGDKIVEGEIDAGHGHASDAAQTVREHGAVHLVPNQLDVERFLTDEKAFEMLLNDAARKCAAAVVGAKAACAIIGENLNDERVLAAAHPEGTNARIGRVDGHGVGNKGLGLPAAAPVLRLAHGRAARAGIARFDSVKFDAGDFHIWTCKASRNWRQRAMDKMTKSMDI